MSHNEREHWFHVRLPAIDKEFEDGKPVSEILEAYRGVIYATAIHEPSRKHEAVDDLRFAAAYIENQLRHPDSRLRHFNARYRKYAAMLENASSRSELMDAASRIRHENARVGLQWVALTPPEKAGTVRPLTAKEIQVLFTEVSPRHYTGEMTIFRLAYSNSGNAARTKTDALMRGEIEPSKEAMCLMESLESRLERPRSTDSLSATKHFLQSLKTPNDELRYKNAFDHNDIYRKLPPAEKDFVYQRAVLQKESLETRLIDKESGRQTPASTTVRKSAAMDFSAFRDELKTRFAEFVTKNPKLDDHELSEGVTLILETSLANKGLAGRVDHESVKALGRELSDGIGKALSRSFTNHSQATVRVPERLLEDTRSRQNRTPDAHTL